MSAAHNTGQPLIVSTPDAIADILAPYLEAAFRRGFEAAASTATDDGRMVKYAEARRITGMGATRFSQAIADGAIPWYPNGTRGKLFKISDLRNFQGYRPQTDAEKRFNQELENRR